jgi:hypothetical protein
MAQVEIVMRQVIRELLACRSNCRGSGGQASLLVVDHI